MIIVQQVPMTIGQLKGMFPQEPFQEMLEWMVKYREVYTYDNISQLHFELMMRLNTMKAARDLLKSKAKFATFATSYCNEEYWNLNQRGAFLLKKGKMPSDAIRDIFENGIKYAFECATAIVIIFYKAALDSIGDKAFNHLFQGLVLYDWHYDEDLGIYTRRGNDFLPGDCLYFKNPDFHPEKPQWRGENTIYLGKDMFYGHGIGIRTADGIIQTLNKYRKEDAQETAYLMQQVTRPDYRYLSSYHNAFTQMPRTGQGFARIGQSFFYC
ncbi:protein-glutamine gamma-glutamyltransferase [Bacillus alveayuensis]|jgi:protein-glutamine gamma-glutamyltransferase|uniref:Protein-glutamine gamma-glutamyltransferase n=1 Tax=Aeribacillus alveayuensis TaxID=279215 RepID=A0ABT9VT27_9BACI|nr:protein-glutamine gamma-glutamyltransferase [Bacillus alveayuensis]MDQ0164030.1 protein-glutamine gamma-glutamyltransferase [Bacillus alveayuensis]